VPNIYIKGCLVQKLLAGHRQTHTSDRPIALSGPLKLVSKTIQKEYNSI